ncbi:hypothetical protein ABZ619_41960 [Streptomyces sp. NPDC007851]|uniref:hypothetical protein n=1 Tax=Streptomyces sp. NPDC007851 TaxID=3155008 RepID=UPI0033E271B4
MNTRKRIALGFASLALASGGLGGGVAVAAGDGETAAQQPTSGTSVTPNSTDDGSQEAVAGTPGAGAFGSDDCISITGGEACFQKYGDVMWVKDTLSDGYPANGDYENYLWNGSSWQLYRFGDCVNHLTAGHWGYCNKDFYEDSTYPNAYGSKGSGIRLFVCGNGSCPDDYKWIRNDA